jgi:hypothetical protein
MTSTLYVDPVSAVALTALRLPIPFDLTSEVRHLPPRPLPLRRERHPRDVARVRTVQGPGAGADR